MCLSVCDNEKCTRSLFQLVASTGSWSVHVIEYVPVQRWLIFLVQFSLHTVYTEKSLLVFIRLVFLLAFLWSASRADGAVNVEQFLFLVPTVFPAPGLAVQCVAIYTLGSSRCILNRLNVIISTTKEVRAFLRRLSLFLGRTMAKTAERESGSTKLLGSQSICFVLYS